MTGDGCVHTQSKALQKETPGALTHVKTEMHHCPVRKRLGNVTVWKLSLVSWNSPNVHASLPTIFIQSLS